MPISFRTFNLEAHGLKEKKSTSVSQGTERRGCSGHRPNKTEQLMTKNVAFSDESQFLLRHTDGRVRLWHQQHESMDPTCLVSTVQAGGSGVMVWGMFSWHTLGPLLPINHCLIASAYVSVVADHVHPFMATMYLYPISYFTKQNLSQTGFINMTIFKEHLNVL